MSKKQIIKDAALFLLLDEAAIAEKAQLLDQL